MAKAQALKTIDGLLFRGASSFPFKNLRGFSKARHTVPDAVNSTTLGFLAKLGAEELGEEMESFFQASREAMKYKRTELSVDTSPPASVLTAKDFTFEIRQGFDGDDAETVRVERTLHSVAELDFLKSGPCETVFGGRFSDLVFTLKKGAPVESVIDAVESLEDSPLAVDYPSDCGHCDLKVPDVDALVRFTGAELVMIFPRAGSPSELLQGFLAVHQAFVLSKDRKLSGLLG